MSPGREIRFRMMLLTGWEAYADELWRIQSEWLDTSIRLFEFRKWKNRE